MYNEEKINDSLEFVKQIKLNDSIDPVHISKEYSSHGYFDIDSIENSDNVFDGISTDDESIISDKLPSGPVSRLKSLFGDIIYIIICVLVSVVLAYGITHYVAHHTIVDGSSMNDSLQDGDCLIIEKVSYYNHLPERFDVIVFPYSEDINYIKRIIGLPGEIIQIIDGYVYVNDVLLEDDIYGNALINDPGVASVPVCLGDDEYFVLGDNRNSSRDSRKSDVGLVKKDSIEGKAVFRIWPFGNWGKVE